MQHDFLAGFCLKTVPNRDPREPSSEQPNARGPVDANQHHEAFSPRFADAAEVAENVPADHKVGESPRADRILHGSIFPTCPIPAYQSRGHTATDPGFTRTGG